MFIVSSGDHLLHVLCAHSLLSSNGIFPFLPSAICYLPRSALSMRPEMDGHSGMHSRMAWTVDLCRTLPSVLPPLLADGPIIDLCLLDGVSSASVDAAGLLWRQWRIHLVSGLGRLARIGEGIKHAMLVVSAVALLVFGLYQLSKAMGVFP
jgi:hypothetical protein